MKDFVTLSEGGGGLEMQDLISGLRDIMKHKGDWQHTDNDSAILPMGEDNLVFTTDSYVVDPIFFPGGDIGKIAACGTINDLSVMGAKPLGLSLGLIIEEGFPKEDLKKIIDSIHAVSDETGIPIVTGDTKVMEKGKVDKIVINTSGVGMCHKDELLMKDIKPGDKVLISGGIGEHAVALLSKRFDFETSIITDAQPLFHPIQEIKDLVKQAKDPTRGGISATLNEISSKNKVGIKLIEDDIPVKKEVRAVTNLLGVSLYELASEGRFMTIVSEENAEKVLKVLKKYNEDAAIIGEIIEGDDVQIQTDFGVSTMHMPSGSIVPRIC